MWICPKNEKKIIYGGIKWSLLQGIYIPISNQNV